MNRKGLWNVYHNGDSHQRGIALIIVLWVLTLLSVIALEFCFGMRTELQVTQNFKEEAQLYYYAQGGVHRAIAELIYKDDPTIQRRRKDTQEGKVVLPEDAQSTMEEEWRTDGRAYVVSFKSGEAEVGLQSEAGRINLNRASDALLRKVMQYFLEAGEQRDVIVDSIQDWRDKDDLHRVNGAEKDYYQSLSEPYECKNGDFDSVEELLLVRGVTPDLFYGKKSKGKQEGGQEDVTIGLKDIFTVYSTVDRININAASAEVLIAVLGISSDLAKQVVDGREGKDYQTYTELQQAVPELVTNDRDLKAFFNFKATMPYYTVTSWAKMKTGESKRGLECVIKVDQREDSGYKVVMWKDILY